MEIPFFNRFFKEKPLPEQPIARELAWGSDTFFGNHSGRFTAYNPDQLIAHKGASIYKQMLRDPQVKSAYNLRTDIIISRSFRFERPDDTDLQKQIEELFRYQIDTFLKGTWSQALRVIMMASAQGFSVTEKVYDTMDWNGSPRWLVRALKPKPYDSFDFEQDRFGNISALIQEQESNQKRLDPRKFIIHINGAEFDNVYGESDLKAAYRAYWEKDIIQKFWNIHLERMSGFLVANPKPEQGGTLSPAELNDFRNILKNITKHTSVMAPQGYELEFVSGTSTDMFQQRVVFCNREISKAMLMPNLLGLSEQGTSGSFAQSKTQLESFFYVINRIGRELEDTANEQFFKELAWWNFGVTEFPKFKFEQMTDEQKREIAETWMSAVEHGIVLNTVNDEKRTRELLQYDPREEGDEVLTDSREEGDTGDKEKKDTPDPEGTTQASEKFAFAEDPEPSGDPTWMERVNFADMEEHFEEQETDFQTELAKHVDAAMVEVRSRLRELMAEMPVKEEVSGTMIENAQKELEKSISTPTKKLMRQTIGGFLSKSYKKGRKTAQGELKKAGANMSDQDITDLTRAINKAQRKMVDWIEEEYVWSYYNFEQGLGLKPAEQIFQAMEFKITGDLTETMISSAKQVLLNAIRDELSIDEAVANLDEVLPGLVGTQDPDTGEIDPKQRNRLENIARTNILTAFNQARMSVWSDPDLDDFVEAIQYSSILDRRTSPFCRDYNGRVFPRDAEVWRYITPPNHFMCRSTTVAVTVLDEWTESTKPKDENGRLLQPAPGFGTIRE